MVKPDKTPLFVRSVVTEARRQGWTAYRISQESGIPVSTARRLLGGELNPTASTIDAVAKALGQQITLAPAK